MSFAQPLPAATQRRVIVPFITCCFIWGSTWFVIGSQIKYLPPLWAISYRFLFGALCMGVVARLMKAPLLLPAKGHPVAFAVGASQFALNYMFVYAAEGHIASGLVALISALLIVPNAILGWWWLGQKVSRRFLVGSAIAMAGIALLCADEIHRSQASAHRMTLGALLSIAGILAASVANVLQGTQAARAQPQPTLLTWSVLYGAILDTIAALLFGGPPHFPLNGEYLAGLLYLVTIGTALSFSAYFFLIQNIGPARAGYIAVIVPILAMALSTLFEGYVWTPLALVGALITLGGLLVAIRARSPA